MPLLSTVARGRAGLGVLLAVVMASAQAQRPPAPVVTSSADIKLLNFDWEVIPQADRYDLWFKADDGAAWVRFMQTPRDQPHAFNNISAHLLNWDQARYQVKACNTSGCATSATLRVKSHMFESIGYFKGASSYAGAQFGVAAAISENGLYIATLAAHEPGGEADPAVVYVFDKTGGAWRQQARIVPSPSTDTRKNRGIRSAGEARLALSGDGSTLVVAMPYRNNTGIGTRSYSSVAIYRRNGSTWAREFQQINPDYVGTHGFAELSEDGNRLVYRLAAAGPLQVLERTSGGWETRAPVPDIPQGPGSETYFCGERVTRLSGDGNTLARVCSSGRGDGSARPYRLLIARAPDWAIQYDFDFQKRLGHAFQDLAIDHAGTTLALSTNPGAQPIDFAGEVQVWKLAGGTLHVHRLQAGAWTDPPAHSYLYGDSIALSRDGAWLAVTDPQDRGGGMGVWSPPLQPTGTETGATYVYDLRNAAPRLRRVLKPNNPAVGVRLDQGVVFANAGKTLLLADPREDGGASGIDGNRNSTAKPDAGALWLY